MDYRADNISSDGELNNKMKKKKQNMNSSIYLTALESSSSVVYVDRHDYDDDLDSDMSDCYWTSECRHLVLMLVVRDRVLSRASIYYCNLGASVTVNAVGIDDVALKPMAFYHFPFPFRDTYLNCKAQANV